MLSKFHKCFRLIEIVNILILSYLLLLEFHKLTPYNQFQVFIPNNLFLKYEPNDQFFIPFTFNINLIFSLSYNESCISPKIYTDVDEITFVSVPHLITTKERLMGMKMAISSWLSVSPKSSVLLFTNPFEFDPTRSFRTFINNLFGRNRIFYATPIKTNENNVPYVNEWFIRGIKQTKSRYVCFLNSDLVVPSNWFNITKKVFNLSIFSEKSPVFITKRINFHLNESIFNSIDFKSYKSNPNQLLNVFEKIVFDDPNRKAEHPCAIDSFTFRADQVPFDVRRIPPFFMGRPLWDGWLVGYMNSVCDTITYGDTSRLYHIEHPRNESNWSGSNPETASNKNNYKPRFYGDNSRTKWMVENGFLVKKLGSTRIKLD